jgi:Ca2+-binding EF-hand superfamily protein
MPSCPSSMPPPFSALLLAACVLPLHGEDLLRGTIDPYDAGRQRAQFLAVAGVDLELSEQEFAADAAGERRFVQPFDQWPALKRFDANGNGTLDWFEALGYRQDLRLRVVTAYDSDGNGCMTGRANEALAKGLVPPPIRTGRGPADASPPAAPPSADRPPRTPQQKFIDRMMMLDDEDPGDLRNVDFQSEMREAFDTDGNGQLDSQEMQAYSQAMQQRLLDHFDTNGDGQIDALEEVTQMDRMSENGLRRAEKQIARAMDRNGDGTIDEQEQRLVDQATRSMRENIDAVQAQRLRKYDADGDGRLSLHEAQQFKAARTARMQRMQDFFSERFDLDGSGRMDSREEFEAMQALQRKAMRHMFGPGARNNSEMLARFDEDGDGRIVGDEQEEMMFQLLKEAAEAER